jgi:histidine ammonia-lyase
MLMDTHHNHGLPANLVPDAGVNSGFMIAQYCAAGLVSENKVLAHPASVDSIPTSSNSEDHNSMATIAARKLRTVLSNVRHTLAIELMVAAQALEWATLYQALSDSEFLRNDLQKNYIQSLITDEQQSVAVESEPGRQKLERRWERAKDEVAIFKSWTFEDTREAQIASKLGQGTRKAYLAVRKDAGVNPLIYDRVLAEDIRKIAELLYPNGATHCKLVARVYGDSAPSSEELKFGECRDLEISTGAAD